MIVRRGLGVVGAFVIGVLAAAIVLAGALISLPFWPPQARDLWRGEAQPPSRRRPHRPAGSAQRRQCSRHRRRRYDAARAHGADGRSREAPAGGIGRRPPSARRQPVPMPPSPSCAAGSTCWSSARPPAARRRRRRHRAASSRKGNRGAEGEIAALRATLSALDQAVATQRDQARDQAKTLSDAVGARNAGEQKALAAARASAVIGVAARLAGSIDAGGPFTAELNLLAPLVQGDGKLSEIVAALQPQAESGVASRAALEAEFPAVARRPLPRTWPTIPSASVFSASCAAWSRCAGRRRAGRHHRSKLARAEQALHAGDIAKAVELVKSLPAQTAKATAAWLAKAEAQLAAKRSLDQLAAYAVNLLGAAH